MTEPSSSPAGAPAPESAPTRKRSFKTPLLLAGVLAVGLTAGAVSSAFSNGPGFMGWGGGWGHHGMGPGGMGPGGMGMGRGMGPGGMGAMDPERMGDFVERGIKHFAVEIDATDEQETKLVAIARSLVTDIAPMRTGMEGARDRVRELLTAPTVDRAAIEAFRAEQIANADTMSKRLAQAVADAAEVLTPEQRQKAGDLTARFGGPHGHGPEQERGAGGPARQ